MPTNCWDGPGATPESDAATVQISANSHAAVMRLWRRPARGGGGNGHRLGATTSANISLAVGVATPVSVAVSAEDGSNATYTLSLTRLPPSPDTSLRSLALQQRGATDPAAGWVPLGLSTAFDPTQRTRCAGLQRFGARTAVSEKPDRVISCLEKATGMRVQNTPKQSGAWDFPLRILTRITCYGAGILRSRATPPRSCA